MVVLKPVISPNSVIDVHAHAVLEETLNIAGSFGPEIMSLA